MNQIIFLSVVAAIGVISSTICAPALPRMMELFSSDFLSIQFIITVFLIGNAFGQLLSGPLSDRIGQRPILLGGLGLFIIASCGCAISETFTQLLCARFLQGAACATGPVLARSIAINYFPPERAAQVLSYGAIGVGIASIFAVLCSGQISSISWRGNFWLCVLLGMILWGWAYTALKKECRPITIISPKQLLSSFKRPEFLGNTLTHSLTYGLMYGYMCLFPFLLIDLFHENNPAQMGIYSAWMIAMYMGGAFLAARLIKKWVADRLITLGLALQFTAGLLLFAFSTPASHLMTLALYNISIGIILPLTSANALAPFSGHAAGAASSALGLTYRLFGAFLTPFIAQLPFSRGLNLAFAMIFFSLLSLGILYRARQNNLWRTNNP